MTYKDRLLHHLANYRRDELRIAEPGTFIFKGRAVQVEHILPEAQPWLGIPAEVRDQVRTFSDLNAVKRHRYFHHLNSSQAFALSLFVPFFEGGPEACSAMLRAMGATGNLAEWKAEYVPVRKEGTNLDAWWRTTEGAQYFCEVKLTEAEFGVAANDDAHRTKLATLYMPRLRDYLPASWFAPETFFTSYQIFRNLWYAAEASDRFVVFLFPRQHKVLTAQLDPVLADITGDLRQRVIVAYAEDVLARLRADSSCPTGLRTYAGRLADKFLLAAP